MSHSLKLRQDLGLIQPQTTLAQVNSVTVDSYTMDGLDSGTIFILNKTTGSTLNLPAPSSGFYTTVIVGTTSAPHVITGSDIHGMIDVITNTQGHFLTSVSTITLENDSKRGDRLDFVSDGTRYYVNGQLGTRGSLTTA